MCTRWCQLIYCQKDRVERNPTGHIHDSEFGAVTAPSDMLQLLVLVDPRNVGNRIGVAERPVAVIGIAGKVAGFDPGPLGVDDGYTA